MTKLNPSAQAGDDRPLRPEAMLGDGETLDAICRGEVLLIQRRDGYRFSIDPILLAHFAGAPRGPAVDLGTGCGIVPLLMARRGARSIVGVELQHTLFQLAWRNVRLNGCESRVEIVNADLRRLRGLLKADGFDLVVSNPPYIAKGAGNVNPDREKAIARHELTASLPELVRAARYLLKSGGAFKVIFPAARLTELTCVLAEAAVMPRRLRMVHPLAARPAKLVLVEAIKDGGDVLDVLPPLVVHDPKGGFGPEVLAMLEEANLPLEFSVPPRPMGQS